MGMFKNTYLPVGMGVLALLTLAVSPAGATEDELSEAMKALLHKIEQIESRMAALEGQVSPVNNGVKLGDPENAQHASGTTLTYAVHREGSEMDAASSEGVSGLDGLDRLAMKVDVLERRLAESSESREAQASVVDEDASADFAAFEERALPTPASRKGAYLPSRGWREGMHYGSEDIDIAIHAFFDLEYTDAQQDGSRSGVSTFDNHHANLFLQAELHPNLIAHTEFEFEHAGGQVEIDQAFVEWAPTNWLSLTAGRFYTPFGIERFVWYSPTNALVTRPQPMRQIIPGNFYANGLMVSGNVGLSGKSRFTYEFAVSDGLGDDALASRRASRQARDNNSDAALSGRLAFVPTPNIEIGASHHSQRYSSTRNLDLRFSGLDLAARWRGWEVRTEYVTASVGQELVDESGSVTAVPDLQQDGWYAQLGYTFHWLRTVFPELTFVTRYETIDLDTAVTGNDDRRLWSVGVNSSIQEHFRVKAEYQFADEDGPSKRDDTFLAQVVVDF